MPEWWYKKAYLLSRCLSCPSCPLQWHHLASQTEAEAVWWAVRLRWSKWSTGLRGCCVHVRKPTQSGSVDTVLPGQAENQCSIYAHMISAFHNILSMLMLTFFSFRSVMIPVLVKWQIPWAERHLVSTVQLCDLLRFAHYRPAKPHQHGPLDQCPTKRKHTPCW